MLRGKLSVPAAGLIFNFVKPNNHMPAYLLNTGIFFTFLLQFPVVLFI